MSDQAELLHEPDQLVVDDQHLEAVTDYLIGIGVGFADIVDDQDADPGLGLIRLRDLVDGSGTSLDVEAVLARVRQRFESDYDGWVPVMGQNRFVDAVVGAGHKPMGEGDPEVPDDSQLAGFSPDPQGTAGAGVAVGLVDTGLYHPDASDAGPVSLHAGHALFVKGLIAAQAPGAAIHLAQALDNQTGRADSWETARAMMRLVAEHDIGILNLSLGCYAPGGPPLVISRAIERLSPAVLVVAAAGNHGNYVHWQRNRISRSAIWPAAIPPVIAVGAYDGTPGGGAVTWSPDAAWVTVTAPGVDVVSAYVDGEVILSGGEVQAFKGAAAWSGTSFAAATTTGAIAARAGTGMSPRAAFIQLRNERDLLRS